ncbi:type IV secretion system DNA-binding domain-containing protein [Actinoplanes sp. Pm04-4]|uniref:Type IV secretion system DNA-binding domain-containing protein n=1 Tax=Paractinoplanes pyxinae TaxID=2997416 RepID=A0ABT4BDX8_9ACTN|nr:DUF87 domain-containing protein [Actinoplanes pyxinae]MCY1144025.1 type IV secretion system DNA-binding domain-containing protein [Actinoplanes pyxinae]
MTALPGATPAPSWPTAPPPTFDQPHLPGPLADVLAWPAGRPWLVLVAAALLAGAAALARAARRRAQRRLEHGAHDLIITPPALVDPAGVTAWWAQLAALLPPARTRWQPGAHVTLEYRWTGRQLNICVWLPGPLAPAPVAAAVRAAWPGASVTVTDATSPLPAGDGVPARGGVLAPALPAQYPLRTDQPTDPLRALIEAGSLLAPGEHACAQILARPAHPRRATALRRAATALRTGTQPRGWSEPETWLRAGLNLLDSVLTPARPAARSSAAPDPVRDRDARAAADKAVTAQWETAIRYAVAATPRADTDPQVIDSRLALLARSFTSAYGLYTGRNRLRQRRLARPAEVLAARRFTRGFLLSAAELATIAALPTDVAVAGLDRARAKSAPAPTTVATGGRSTKVLGRAQAGGHAVALRVADSREHLHVLGATGSGKSTLMTHLILDDIRAHRGVIVIDPKGDLAVDVLERLPVSVADRLVLIDPDQDGGATLNPLLGDDDDLVVDNIVSIFSRIFQRHWGPRIDDVLRVACLTLMRHANPTLMLIPPLLNDRQFRASFTAGLDDPEGLKGFWEWYETMAPPLRAQVIGPVLARLRAFLLRDFVRATLGAATSSFDMRDVLDGGILIARLPKGVLGEDTAKLLGSLLFASVWQAATARARLPEARRRDASVYIDEAHNVLNLAGSVSDMLAEARGYHLSLTLAHQNLTQLPRDTQLALSANARNKIFFNCSPEDAHQLARHTLPELDEHDLSHLDAYTAATRLVVANRETAAFTLRTSAPAPVLGRTRQLRQAVARTTPAAPTAIAQLARRTRTAGGPAGE